jgi:FMN phosphatase YigB (HAD superfamily)
VRISFDLDDTLICGPSVPTEQHVRWWSRWRYPERIRHGARELMKELTRRECRIWIYTSSDRPIDYLKAWFGSMRIPVEGVINQTLHEQRIGLRGPSKYPPAFQIDLHIDDSPGVAMEGADHQFNVLVISPDDPHWTQRVLSEVDARIQSNPHWRARQLPPSRRFDVRRIFRELFDQPELAANRLEY